MSASQQPGSLFLARRLVLEHNGDLEMKIGLLSVLVCLLQAQTTKKETKPPAIDYKLQFETRTLESRYNLLALQLQQIKADREQKMYEMQKICGDGFSVVTRGNMDEYVCEPSPPARNEAATGRP